jgi:tetraprenyl-beta-curcumene synthase
MLDQPTAGRSAPPQIEPRQAVSGAEPPPRAGRPRPGQSQSSQPQADWPLAARSAGALALANVRYWSSVAPSVHTQLRRWRTLAHTIEDPSLRALALGKLEHEGFNAEAAAMLATLAPRRHRRATVEAIVAVEIMYDYLDGLTETPSYETPDDGYRLFRAFTDAVAPSVEPGGNYYRDHACMEDCYLEALVGAARSALATLPGIASLAEVLHTSAGRGAEAQLQIHAAALSGPGPLRRWAQRGAADTPLQWREFLAGAACSVLGVHALIAAAADARTTVEQAREIDRIYLSISVLPTVLDSLLDHELDVSAGQPGYLQHYEDSAALTHELTNVIHETISRARRARHGAHHVMTLAGVLAYYFSTPTAGNELARPVVEHIGRELGPLLTPTLAMMRVWRAAKRVRARWRALTSRSERRRT